MTHVCVGTRDRRHKTGGSDDQRVGVVIFATSAAKPPQPKTMHIRSNDTLCPLPLTSMKVIWGSNPTINSCWVLSQHLWQSDQKMSPPPTAQQSCLQHTLAPQQPLTAWIKQCCWGGGDERGVPDVQAFKDVMIGLLLTPHAIASLSASDKGDGEGGITLTRSNRAMSVPT